MDSSIMLVGLSGTGKTNYLVGLDVILDNQTDPNGLKHSDHSDDRAYVQPLRELWLRGEELGHTSRQLPPTPHQLLIHHPASGTHTAFHIPDLAGESFDAQFVTRSFPQDLVERIKSTTGMMLFLHCNHESNHDLHERPELTDAATDAPSEVAASEPSHEAWKIEHSCRQVKLVDLLQFISEIRTTPLRVAVSISAWDCVEQAPGNLLPKNPASFLEKKWPLLHQFLVCNRDHFPSHSFGISARGGGTSPEEILRITSLAHACERVIIVDCEHRSNDLTRPVRWLLNLMPAPSASNA